MKESSVQGTALYSSWIHFQYIRHHMYMHIWSVYRKYKKRSQRRKMAQKKSNHSYVLWIQWGVLGLNQHFRYIYPEKNNHRHKHNQPCFSGSPFQPCLNKSFSLLMSKGVIEEYWKHSMTSVKRVWHTRVNTSRKCIVRHGFFMDFGMLSLILTNYNNTVVNLAI